MQSNLPLSSREVPSPVLFQPRLALALKISRNKYLSCSRYREEQLAVCNVWCIMCTVKKARYRKGTRYQAGAGGLEKVTTLRRSRGGKLMMRVRCLETKPPSSALWCNVANLVQATRSCIDVLYRGWQMA